MTKAPFTPDQVESINSYQRAGIMHPFTCGDIECLDDTDLVAGPDGLKCPHCGWTQDWVHDFMADWTWRPPDDWPFGVPPSEQTQ